MYQSSTVQSVSLLNDTYVLRNSMVQHLLATTRYQTPNLGTLAFIYHDISFLLKALNQLDVFILPFFSFECEFVFNSFFINEMYLKFCRVVESLRSVL